MVKTDSTARGADLIPDLRTKIPYAIRCSQKFKKDIFLKKETHNVGGMAPKGQTEPRSSRREESEKTPFISWREVCPVPSHPSCLRPGEFPPSWGLSCPLGCGAGSGKCSFPRHTALKPVFLKLASADVLFLVCGCSLGG